MENICDWKNCKEKGEFRAPIEKITARNLDCCAKII